MKHFKLFMLLFLASCTANASTMDQILDEISRRRATLDEIYISYHVTVENYKIENPATSAGKISKVPASASNITTFSVMYTHKGNQSQFVRDQCDTDGNCTHHDATWADKGTSAVATMRGNNISSLYDPPLGAPDDVPTLYLLEYWMYLGFTPKWLKLDDDYDIEYNIPRHFHDQATAVYDNQLTTLTYQGRYIYVFDGFQLVKMERLSRTGGPVTLSVTYTYDQSIGPIFPAKIVADTFNSVGTIETRKVITVTELTTNFSGGS